VKKLFASSLLRCSIFTETTRLRAASRWRATNNRDWVVTESRVSRKRRTTHHRFITSPQLDRENSRQRSAVSAHARCGTRW